VTEALEGVRIDKWLWAARFFKTRQLAIDAINGGKVHLNGQRTKPGRILKPGARLQISKGPLEWDVEVKGISRQRGPASEAALLYEETEESRERREELTRERRELGVYSPGPRTRPNKRDRRLIHRFLDEVG
jgi:ribosome-associated heat shock protein Hsp15